MLPIYLNLLGADRFTVFSLIYTLAVSFLLVSTLPVFSGKRVGKRVPTDLVLPIFVFAVLFVALLVSYPWWVLTIGTLCYLVSLPFGWMAYRRHQAQDDAQAQAQAAASPDESMPSLSPLMPEGDDERPNRLN
jgi:CDP-diacylglycerol--serine O-phosphatidyltransferase